MVDVGQVCPQGSLPVYSVDTEREAKMLVAGTCKMNLDGDMFAPEMLDDETGEPHTGRLREHHFVEFGLRLQRLHEERLAMEKV